MALHVDDAIPGRAVSLFCGKDMENGARNVPPNNDPL